MPVCIRLMMVRARAEAFGADLLVGNGPQSFVSSRHRVNQNHGKNAFVSLRPRWTPKGGPADTPRQPLPPGEVLYRKLTPTGSQVRDLEQTIAGNVAEILER